MKRYISQENTFPHTPIRNMLALAMICTVWNFGPMMWLTAAIISFIQWVVYIRMYPNIEVDVVKKLDILERKIELLWADIPEEKRTLLKLQINEMLKAEGLIEPESKLKT